QPAQVQGKFSRQSGGRGQYGDVHIEFTPNEQGAGFEFEDAIVGGVVPREYIPSVEEGLKNALENGVLAGYPLVDVKAKLYDGSYHDVDSSEMAFKIAASLALKEAAKKCKPVLLEPVMKVEVVKVNLCDGACRAVDSSDMPFKLAASLALKEAAKRCKPVLLEPVMKVEVVMPEEYLGDIMGDVTSRRGRVEGMEARGNAQVV